VRFAPVLIALSLVLATGAVSTASASSSSTTTTVVSTRPKGPVAPLTGLPDPTRVSHRRSALTIKIDNTPEAHPQYGLEKADVVYEEIVEGGITRLAAIFNSRLIGRVGPVRSVRRTDRAIVTPIGGIFAFSGGAQYAISSIEKAPVKLFSQSNAGSAMFRDYRRPPPHNLFANAIRLMAMGGRVHVPPPLFKYALRSAPAVGPRVASFTVNLPAGYAATYAWDGRSHSWDRSIFGRPDVEATGQRMSPTNVVVMNVTYAGGVGVEGSAAVLTGTGPVLVFTNGRLQRGHWSRSRLNKVTAYRSASGRDIKLRPGQTFVELEARGESVTIHPAG